VDATSTVERDDPSPEGRSPGDDEVSGSSDSDGSSRSSGDVLSLRSFGGSDTEWESDAGNDHGATPGSDPGTDPGSEPGGDPGADPGGATVVERLDQRIGHLYEIVERWGSPAGRLLDDLDEAINVVEAADELVPGVLAVLRTVDERIAEAVPSADDPGAVQDPVGPQLSAVVGAAVAQWLGEDTALFGLPDLDPDREDAADAWIAEQFARLDEELGFANDEWHTAGALFTVLEAVLGGPVTPARVRMVLPGLAQDVPPEGAWLVLDNGFDPIGRSVGVPVEITVPQGVPVELRIDHVRARVVLPEGTIVETVHQGNDSWADPARLVVVVPGADGAGRDEASSPEPGPDREPPDGSDDDDAVVAMDLSADPSSLDEAQAAHAQPAPADQPASGYGDEVREVTSYPDEWPGFLPGEVPPSGATILLDAEFERDRPLPGGTAVTVFVPAGVPLVRRSGADGPRLLLPAGTRLLVEGVRFDVGTRVVELVVLLPGTAVDEGGR
jgi:hypothetical protein